MNDLKNRAFGAFAWDFSGRMVQYLVSFVISVFLARLLEPEAFGLVAMVLVIVNFSQVFVDSGLGVSLIQKKNVTSEHYGSVFWFNVFIGLILTLIFYFSAPLISSFYEQEELTDLTKTLSFIFIINAFGRVASARLSKDLRHHVVVKANFVASVTSGAVGVTLAFMGYGVWALVIQSMLNDGIKNLLLIILSKYKIEIQFSMHALRELWFFGFRMFLSGLLNRIFQSADNIIIGKLFTPGTLGFFNRGKNLKMLLFNNLAGSLMKVVFPTLSEIQDENERFLRAIEKTLTVVAFFTFFAVGLLYLIADDLIIMLYGDKWAETIPYFKLFLLSAFANPLNSVFVNVLSSRGNSKAFLRVAIIKKIIMTIVFVVGFYFGITGFLIGLIVNSFLGTALNIVYAASELDISTNWFIKRLWKYIISGLVTYFIMVILPFESNIAYINTIVVAISYFVIYIAINYGLGTKAISLIKTESKEYFKRKK